jgi:hypothetical protein
MEPEKNLENYLNSSEGFFSSMNSKGGSYNKNGSR